MQALRARSQRRVVTAHTTVRQGKGGVVDVANLAARVLEDAALQESHWLEWKSAVDLGQRVWHARVARFVLGAANRPRALAAAAHDGHAFMLLGLEPGRAVGTPVVDPAVVGDGLARFLGTAEPHHTLDYVAVAGVTVAVVTVRPTPSGTRPHLARASYSGDKAEIQDGRVYVRRSGSTAEASSSEVDDMLAERVAARVAAGPTWPLQAVDAWRDGNVIHVRQGRDDRVHVHGYDNYTNLSEMASIRPALPASMPRGVAQRVAAMFDPLLARADSEPGRAVDDAHSAVWSTTMEVCKRLLYPSVPFSGFKFVDMVTELFETGHVEAGWVDVAYPLRYWPRDQPGDDPAPAAGAAKTYVALARAFASALLLAAEPPAAAERAGG